MKNFEEIQQNSEFSNLKNFIASKINSPYEEVNYIIRSNDTVEKILKKYKVQNEEIKKISVQLKQKKLTNTLKKILILKSDNERNTLLILYIL